ncbi:MAG: prepilin-type N-terminal cleavage/methylation domain-containing protein, partial [Proteobacteria bacterium]|nr:prepilin-type N-terminal cleavage/methylation domain-containing protein [Pseudomonadota bacterium]
MQKANGQRAARGRRRSGFTMVELLVTLAVTSVLLALVYQIFISQQRSQSIQEEVADAQQNARVGADALTRALSSLGAGADLERGQVRILVAHADEIVFNADLASEDAPADRKWALPPGTALPAAWITAQDPYPTVPGTYVVTATAGPLAETHRYYLAAQGAHATLYHQMGYYSPSTDSVVWGTSQQVALNLANQRIGEPLFRYHGDFGGIATLDTVDAATSPRLAAGDPLDALIERIELNVVTETSHPDPRYPEDQGYRLTRLNTSVTPRNLWDCPVVAVDQATVPDDDPSLAGHQVRREASLFGQPATQIWFRVARGGLAEPGQTVNFSLTGLPSATVTAAGVTDANGRVQATITWPPT